MKEHYHFIGIGGIGMSGLARILAKRQHPITGSDISKNYVTEGLEKAGIPVQYAQHYDNIQPFMHVVYSSDIKNENPELKAAHDKGCHLWHRSDLLAQLVSTSKGLAVSGTHGKTTTSSLLATVLKEAGWDPTFVVGGIIGAYQTNASEGKGEYIAIEADESDGTLTKYHPFGAIITNIDGDHLNHFKTMEALISSFKQFASQVSSPDHLFWCGDDPLLSNCEDMLGKSYGFASSNDLQITRYLQTGWQISFDCTYNGRVYSDIEVPLTGKHNALNSAAVFGLCLELGMDDQEIRMGLKSFKGVKRRCEKKGEMSGIVFLDDYAHHPTEIDATLKAVRHAIGTSRLMAIFQPHRYTRLQYCLNEFEGVFDHADMVIITDIYSAGEQAIPGVTKEKIIESITKTQPSCHYIPRQQLTSEIMKLMKPNDVVITLGAGDITKVAQEVIFEGTSPCT